MRVFDFNIHLPAFTDGAVNDRVASEMNATPEELIERFDQVSFIDEICGANYMIFNSAHFLRGSGFTDHVRSQTENASFTLLVDFRAENALEHIEKGEEAGINAIKFHSYQQRITADDFDRILKICRYAESKNLIICLDGSYGTAYMLTYDIVDLICTVAQNITKTPIVVLHSGGLKCLSMFLLAADRPNVFLETSATLPIYIGSSIEQDLAFTYKSLPEDRVLFASDDPYFNFSKTLETARTFFDKHDFSAHLQDRIFAQNALELLNF